VRQNRVLSVRTGSSPCDSGRVIVMQRYRRLHAAIERMMSLRSREVSNEGIGLHSYRSASTGIEGWLPVCRIPAEENCDGAGKTKGPAGCSGSQPNTANGVKCSDQSGRPDARTVAERTARPLMIRVSMRNWRRMLRSRAPMRLADADLSVRSVDGHKHDVHDAECRRPGVRALAIPPSR